MYKNKLFTFAASSVLGSVMRVETQMGKTFEGVFTTYSSEFEVVLEQVCEVGPDGAPASHQVKEKMVFPNQQIIRCQCVDVDMDFATKGELLYELRIFNTQSRVRIHK